MSQFKSLSLPKMQFLIRALLMFTLATAVWTFVAMSSIGLGALLLAAAGFVHSFFVLRRINNRYSERGYTPRLMWLFAWSGLMIALAAFGVAVLAIERVTEVR